MISRFCQLLDRLVIKNLASKPSTVTTLLLQSLASPKRFVPTISARAKRSCFYVWKMESEIKTESESTFFLTCSYVKIFFKQFGNRIMGEILRQGLALSTGISDESFYFVLDVK